MGSMTRLWPALPLVAIQFLPQQAPLQTPPVAAPRDSSFIQRVKAHMVETLARQPNYTCLESVERSVRAAKERDYRLQDTVRLEVALVDSKEMFAWPGSKEFQDTDIRTFVPTGMFGNGDFGLYAHTVFGGRTTEFEDKGEAALRGAPIARLDFRVPQGAGMRISVPALTARVGFHGSAYVEPGTLDTLRLEVVADELPPKLELREVSDTMEYKRIRIGGGEFLLPSMSEAIMVTSHGDATRNVVRFSACHEFAGESTLKFGDDDAPGATDATAAPKQEVQIPKNAEVVIRLAAEIDTQKAAVGDPVRAALAGDLKEKGKVILPKGLEVSGRIVRLERYESFTLLGLMFQEAESEKVHAYLNLNLDRAVGADMLPPNQRWSAGSPPRPHEGLVPLRSGHLRVDSMIMYWRN
jgi:hypothetical protein